MSFAKADLELAIKKADKTVTALAAQSQRQTAIRSVASTTVAALTTVKKEDIDEDDLTLSAAYSGRALDKNMLADLQALIDEAKADDTLQPETP